MASSSVVGAVGDDPAVVEQHDPVGQGDGGGPVGDDDRGAPGHDLAEGVADLVLLGGVDRRGGVVEDQHPGVGQDGPGDGDALALAARQREAPLADLGAVALGQRRDELVGAGEAGRPLDVDLVGVGVGEGDVGGDRVAEQERVLEHEADGPAQLEQRHVPHVDAVEARPGRRRRRRSGAAGGRRSTCPLPVAPTRATDSPGAMPQVEAGRAPGMAPACRSRSGRPRSAPRRPDGRRPAAGG